MTCVAVGTYEADNALMDQVRATGVAAVRVYRPDGVAVVLGRGSRAEVELNLRACSVDSVPVLRRPGGGCAVVLDPGNVIVSVAMPLAGIGGSRHWMDLLSRWLIAGLAKIGLADVRCDGVSDLVYRGRKISGACIFRPRGLLYYSATLLVDADLDRIARYLAHPPREPDYRGGRRHSEFLTKVAAPGLSGASDVHRALDDCLTIADLTPDSHAR